MSTRLMEKEEKIRFILENLVQESARGTPIIVEGKKDVEALKALGVCGKILSAKTGGKSLLEVVSEIVETGAKEVILMLDFDRRGRECTRRLKQRFEKAGVNPNLNFWNALQAMVRREVKDIEGLTSYMKTLESKTKG